MTGHEGPGTPPGSRQPRGQGRSTLPNPSLPRSSQIRRLTRLADVASSYSFFVVDQWGCLHDGVQPHPGAREVLEALRSLKRPVALVSNSSRPAAPSQAILDRLGFPDRLYGAMLTAGQLAERHLVSAWEQGTIRTVLSVLGPAGPTSVVRTLGLETTEDVAKADVLVASGVHSHPPERWDSLFQQAAARGLELLCLNPDLRSVLPDGRLVFCPGAFARRYAHFGGSVRQWGKPGLEIYRAAWEALGCPPGRGLGVGDSLHHDILGANRAGLDSLLIGRGVHWRELGAQAPGEPVDPGALSRLVETVGIAPTHVMPVLRW